MEASIALSLLGKAMPSPTLIISIAFYGSVSSLEAFLGEVTWQE
jgi:hypothetical protein